MKQTARRSRIWAFVFFALGIAALAAEQPLLEWVRTGYSDLERLASGAVSVVYLGGFVIGAALIGASVVIGAINREVEREGA